MRRLLLLALIWPSAPSAAGWTQPEGGYYLKLHARTMVGNRAYFEDGSSGEVPESFVDTLLNVYGELGLADALTLIAQASPLGFAQYGDESTTVVGALGLGLRAGLALGDTRLALEGRYSYAPSIGEEVLGEDVADGKPIIYLPTVETHAGTLEAQVGQPLPFGWLAGSVGGRLHSRDGLDPAIVGFFQIGWNATETLQVDMHVNLYEPLGEVDATNVSGAGQTRYLGFGPSLSWWAHPQWALNGGFEGVFYAQSNAATPTLILGVEHRGAL